MQVVTARRAFAKPGIERKAQKLLGGASRGRLAIPFAFENARNCRTLRLTRASPTISDPAIRKVEHPRGWFCAPKLQDADLAGGILLAEYRSSSARLSASLTE